MWELSIPVQCCRKTATNNQSEDTKIKENNERNQLQFTNNIHNYNYSEQVKYKV